METDLKGVLQAVQAEMNPQYFASAVTAQKGVPPGPVPGIHAPVSGRVQTTHSLKLPPKAATPYAPVAPATSARPK
jgi:hypothetical protein